MNKLVGLFLIFFASVIATSCDETMDDLVCDHCDASTPYSNVDSQTCYELKSDCETALGSTCVICTP